MKKNNIIQIMRGIAIVIVLIHHAISQSGAGVALTDFDSILICFHMPTFFIISGYLYERGMAGRKKTINEFICGKAMRLLVPYTFWTVFLWIGVQIGNAINAFLMKSIGFPPMTIKDLLVNLLTYEIFYVELLWFPYVLFVYFVVHRLIGHIGYQKWFLAVAFVLGLTTVVISYPNILSRFLLWALFFAFGRAITQNPRIENTIRNGTKYVVPILTAFMILVAVRIMLNHIELYNSVYIYRVAKQIIKYLIGFLGSWIIYIVAVRINDSRTLPLFKTVGDFSYDIYLMHNPYIVAVSAIVCTKYLNLPSVCAVIVATFLGIVLPIMVSKRIIRNSRILSAIVIGKW